jgi:white-opaque regulator 2
MLAYNSFQMNYPNMTTAGMQQSSASISLPPISSIDFRVQAAHHSPQEVVQPLPPPPPPRHLPPLGYYNGGGRLPQEPQYVQQRPLYAGMQMSSPYGYGHPTRVPLPSTTDPSLIVAPTRHKTKEVKRRTKTGCLTCRKRRIKVSDLSLCFLIFHFQPYR